MPRTPTNADIKEFPVTEVIEKNTAELAVSMNANDIANAIVNDKFNTIEALGIIKAASFYTSVSEKLIAETAINIRDGKKYKGLVGKDQNGHPKQVSDFEEFCELFLGKSARRVQQLMSNYNQLGPDLYEQAEKIGFRQRDYNALKSLPADDKLIIAQAIEAEDLDKALDLMQQLAAKHQREKEVTEKQIDELVKSVGAKDSVIKGKSKFIDQLEEKLATVLNKKTNENPETTVDSRVTYARDQMQNVAVKIKTDVMTELRVAVQKLIEDTPGENTQLAAACLIEIAHELTQLRSDFNLPSVISDTAPLDATWAALHAEQDAE